MIITANSAEQVQNAQQLADELGFTFSSAEDTQSGYVLTKCDHYLGLTNLDDKKAKPFYIDLLSGTLRYRSAQAGFKKELVARSIGCKPKDNPSIVDATAGLGRDAFILASLGFTVTLLERSPVLYALLRDAMQRAFADPQTAEIMTRMQLIHTDAIDWLSQQTDKPQIIYIDPMFPSREKSALVKKEMVILQSVVGKDLDANQLFSAALSCATQRVVVKRPRLAPNISEQAPHYTLSGRSSRFDVYMV